MRLSASKNGVAGIVIRKFFLLSNPVFCGILLEWLQDVLQCVNQVS